MRSTGLDILETTRPIVTTPAPGETTTIGGPFVCPAPDGLFDNPADCDTYYSCSNSIPILQVFTQAFQSLKRVS